ncbi:tetratricopeptide repeat protein [Bacillus sp. es.036]|uniref:tetratricopeptide repeat protein n=1 Tax=Bacillus sp. es.036 TaxID=1761764 RepID=UPI000BF625FD|nr:tetratricopeptide repeat protein [Bacillus sp. es.036]PFG12363.1 tetratricopeptide repeat protein [Bacillus sp. es.036]
MGKAIIKEVAYFVDLSVLIFKKALPGSTIGHAYIVLALFANKLYFDFALNKIKKLKNLYPDRDERFEVLRKRGGVSWLFALLFVVVMMVYGFGITYLEEEVYYSYMEPKFTEAAELQDSGKLDEAMDIYNDIENDNVAVPSIHFNKGLIYEEQGEYDQALSEMNTYLSLEPDDQEAKGIKDEIKAKID